MLDRAISDIRNHINIHQDGEIGDNGFRRLGGDALTLTANDANNHHLTWGVLGAALEAVKNYMSQSDNRFGMVYFSIFDGENQTGHGSIQ